MRNWKQLGTRGALTIIVAIQIGALTLVLESGLAATNWVRDLRTGDASGCAGVLQASDGGFFAVGWARTIGAGYSDMLLVKLDASGVPVWDRTYGGANRDDMVRATSTSDGGMVLIGLSTSFGAWGHAPLIIKLNSNGDVQWQRTLLRSGREWGFDITETSDGGFLVAGGIDGEYAAATKISLSGDIVWEQFYCNGMLNTIRETPDGGCIAMGRTDQTNGYDLLALRLDGNGVEQWRRVYGGSGFEAASDVQVTSDGGFLVTGGTFSFGSGGSDLWLLKLTPSGDVQWQKVYGGAADDAGLRLKLTSDGGAVISGVTYSFGPATPNGWMLKVDSVGNVIWQRSYDLGAVDHIWDVLPTSDGGYLAAVGGDPTFSGGFFVMKLRADGTVSPDCPAGIGAPTNATVLSSSAVPAAGPGGGGDPNFSSNIVNVTVTTPGVVGTEICSGNSPSTCDTMVIRSLKLHFGPDGCKTALNLSNCTPLKGATIPLKYDPLPPGWQFDSVSFLGARMADWDLKQTSHKSTDRTILVNALVNTNGTGKTEEPAGTGPLFYLWFSGPTSNYTCSELIDTVCIDTTTIPGSPSPKKLVLVDNGTPAQGFVPIFERGCISLHHFQIVDFNCDGVLDVIDLVNIIDYVFSGGPCLPVCEAGDVNGDGVVDVFDVVAAIDCVFSGGLCPVCFDAAPVPDLARRVRVEAIADIQTGALIGNGWTATLSIQAPAPWRAAQLEWTFDGPVDQLSVAIEEGASGLKTYWHLDGRQLKVGLIDIRGEAQIAAGARPVLRLSGAGDFPGVRLTDGLLVDQNNQGISVSPVAAAAVTSGIPSSFSLGANYPNPFNAGTVIRYNLGEAGPAKLEVFNILGGRMRTLVDESKSAGPHEVAWDSRDGRGQAVPSGMYFYRLTAGGFADSKKMILLK